MSDRDRFISTTGKVCYNPDLVHFFMNKNL